MKYLFCISMLLTTVVCISGCSKNSDINSPDIRKAPSLKPENKSAERNKSTPSNQTLLQEDAQPLDLHIVGDDNDWRNDSDELEEKAILPELFNEKAEEKPISISAEAIFEENATDDANEKHRLPKVEGADIHFEMKID